jgi:L-rhamnose isomerase / sugar isomerase
VHVLTGVCPTVALHVQWDLPNGLADVSSVMAAASRHAVRPGAVNPNLFQDQDYKFGSFGNPDQRIRRRALDHCLESVRIARALGSRDLSLWFADGSNYPGTADIRARKRLFAAALADVHAALDADRRLLIEYKPFEPAFYHTDIADWGMALLLARQTGPQAKVLVDTGHHYASQNIEQIVAWLLDEGMLGGFHFNDRRYADDDLTFGSIDPYQAFRIFHEILFFEWQSGAPADIAFVIDQSHNLKGKIEAMIQTVDMAQGLYAKAALVDRDRLAAAQQSTDLVAAERCLQDAFATDVRPAVAEWRAGRQLPPDPLQSFRESGYLDRITKERAARPRTNLSSYA